MQYAGTYYGEKEEPTYCKDKGLSPKEGQCSQSMGCGRESRKFAVIGSDSNRTVAVVCHISARIGVFPALNVNVTDNEAHAV